MTIEESYLFDIVCDEFTAIEEALVSNPTMSLGLFPSITGKLIKSINSKGIKNIKVGYSYIGAEFNQIFEIDGIAITSILEDEVDFYKFSLTRIKNFITSGKMFNSKHNEKIQLTIPQAQLAILTRIIWDAGLINSTSKTALFRRLLTTFNTQRSSDPSTNKFSQKFYGSFTMKDLSLFDREVLAKMNDAFAKLKRQCNESQ